jgi:hypothetical protein
MDCPRRELLIPTLSHLSGGPGIQSWLSVIREGSKTSSGGKSRLSYAILQDLDECNQTLLYNLMLHIWNSGKFPGWMCAKILCPIPKMTERPVNINKIRPVVLVEVLRKCFVKAIVRQISAAVEKYKVLHHTQYGFRSQRNCQQAILQFLNVIEFAHFEKRPVYMTSWDISSASDSVTRPLAELLLDRIGVPSVVSGLIATMDNEDSITTASSWAKKCSHPSSFSSEIGCGQGDVHSTLIWNLVMGIIIRAIKRSVQADIIFPLFNRRWAYTKDTVYADDMLSYNVSLDNIQKKAEIFSAGCSLLGLNLATDKFRSFIIAASPRVPPPSVFVYDHVWSPTEICFSTKGFLRYLGSTHDIDLSGSAEKEKLSAYIKETVLRMQQLAHGAPAHTVYTNGALLPKYYFPVACLSMLSLKELRNLELEIAWLVRESLDFCPDTMYLLKARQSI